MKKKRNKINKYPFDSHFSGTARKTYLWYSFWANVQMGSELLDLSIYVIRLTITGFNFIAEIRLTYSKRHNLAGLKFTIIHSRNPSKSTISELQEYFGQPKQSWHSHTTSVTVRNFSLHMWPLWVSVISDHCPCRHSIDYRIWMWQTILQTNNVHTKALTVHPHGKKNIRRQLDNFLAINETVWNPPIIISKVNNYIKRPVATVFFSSSIQWKRKSLI